MSQHKEITIIQLRLLQVQFEITFAELKPTTSRYLECGWEREGRINHHAMPPVGGHQPQRARSGRNFDVTSSLPVVCTPGSLNCSLRFWILIK